MMVHNQANLLRIFFLVIVVNYVSSKSLHSQNKVSIVGRHQEVTEANLPLHRFKRSSMSLHAVCPRRSMESHLERSARHLNNLLKHTSNVKSNNEYFKHHDSVYSTNCCEIISTITKSVCSMLNMENDFTSDQMKTYIYQSQSMIKALKLQSITQSSSQNNNRNRRRAGFRTAKMRFNAYSSYYQTLRSTFQKKCEKVETNQILSPLTYTRYFLQHFQSCQTCTASRKCF